MRPFISFVVVSLLGLGIGIGVAHAAPPMPGAAETSAPVHPHRIVVKYKSTVRGCADCLPGSGARSGSGAAELDSLNRRFSVRGAHALFSREAGGDRSAGYRSRLAGAAARFPVRAGRAPRGAAVPDLANVYVVELGAKADPRLAAAAFAADPNVEYAEPDYEMRVSYLPSDPYFSSSGSFGQSFPDLWGLHALDISAAWEVARGDGIVVAVIDTGVSHTHRELRGNLWSNPGEIPRNRIDDDGNGFVDDVTGWDFEKNRNQPRDRHGHGTHVAGTIAANGDNGRGVVGVSFGSRLMAVRGFDEQGRGYSSDLAKCIEYAAENGADVLNNSWGGAASSVIADAVTTAVGLGAVVVFAAGNGGSTYLGPAADPNVIAVAATAYGDVRAAFSNHGPGISVAAPGVDVLSLRGPSHVGGRVVAGQYKVLSGTSMAAPHVSGVVALLLSTRPSLTTEEVRWHLELNADQPGAPGYEGKPWNPDFGWGRVNAARVFDDPPVTTRIRTQPFSLHGLSDVLFPDAASVAFQFTSLSPIPWMLATPPWLLPSIGSGAGDSTVSLALDGRTIAPGTYTDAVSVSAPLATNGDEVAVTATFHQDVRVDGPVVLTSAYRPYGGTPVVASDGSGLFAAWVELPPDGGPDLVGAYLAADGSVTGPFPIDVATCIEAHCHKKTGSNLAVVFDGGSFLVAWQEEIETHVGDTFRHVRHDLIRAKRVTSEGQVLDSQPITLAENLETEDAIGSYDQFYFGVEAGFDGTAYTVLWGRLDYGSTYEKATKIYLRRVSPGGALVGAAAQIYPAADTAFPQFVTPQIACLPGSCLVVWHEADGELAGWRYIDKLYGKRYAGTTPIDAAAIRLLTDAEGVNVIASDGTGYLLGAWRAAPCPNFQICGFDVVVTRVTADAVPLDPAGLRLNNPSADGSRAFVAPNAIVFDGTSYIVSWLEGGAEGATGCYPFAARVTPAGVLLDTEPEGSLLAPGAVASCDGWALGSVATRSFLVGAEVGASPTRIVAQGIFPQ